MTRQRPLSDALSCVLRWAAGQTDTAKERPTRHRASRTLIILIDGTLSTDLARGARNTCWLAIQAVGAKHDDHQRATYLGAVVGKLAHQLARVGAARPMRPNAGRRMKQVHPTKWSRCGFQGLMRMSGGIYWGMNQRGLCPIFPLFG